MEQNNAPQGQEAVLESSQIEQPQEQSPEKPASMEALLQVLTQTLFFIT